MQTWPSAPAASSSWQPVVDLTVVRRRRHYHFQLDAGGADSATAVVFAGRDSVDIWVTCSASSASATMSVSGSLVSTVTAESEVFAVLGAQPLITSDFFGGALLAGTQSLSPMTLALDTAQRDYALAVEILNCRRLIKGYSDTHVRAHSKFDRVLSGLPLLEGRDDAADWLRRLREAALKDEKGEMLDGALKTVATLEAA